MRRTDAASPQRFQFSVVNGPGQELGLGKFVILGVIKIGAVVDQGYACIAAHKQALRVCSGGKKAHVNAFDPLKPWAFGCIVRRYQPEQIVRDYVQQAMVTGDVTDRASTQARLRVIDGNLPGRR